MNCTLSHQHGFLSMLFQAIEQHYRFEVQPYRSMEIAAPQLLLVVCTSFVCNLDNGYSVRTNDLSVSPMKGTPNVGLPLYVKVRVYEEETQDLKGGQGSNS